MAVSPSSLNLTRMVDIHCHLLPETDDGAISLEESVAMCRAAAEDGIKTIVATPHMFNGVYAAPDNETIGQKIAMLTQACDACVTIDERRVRKQDQKEREEKLALHRPRTAESSAAPTVVRLDTGAGIAQAG